MHLPDDQPKFDLHPDRLRALSILFKLPPPQPVEQAQIVLLGVSHGANALALACEYPSAKIIAVTSAAVYAQRIQETCKHLKIKNLRTLSVSKWLDFNPKTPIDYVLCHGYYSYLSDTEKQCHTAQIAKVLHPQGMVYIDYLTTSGWQAFESMQYILTQIYPVENLQSIDEATLNQSINLLYQHLPATHPLHHQLNHIMPDMSLRTHPSLNGYWSLKQAQTETADDFLNRLHELQLGYVCDSDISRYYFQALPPDIQAHCGLNRHLSENLYDLLIHQSSRASVIMPIAQLLQFHLPTHEEMYESLDLLHISGHFQLNQEQTVWRSTLNPHIAVSATVLNSMLLESINHVYHANCTLAVKKLLELLETKFKAVPDIHQSAYMMLLSLVLSGALHIRSQRQNGFHHQSDMVSLHQWRMQHDPHLTPANKWLQPIAKKELEVMQIAAANAQ